MSRPKKENRKFHFQLKQYIGVCIYIYSFYIPTYRAPPESSIGRLYSICWRKIAHDVHDAHFSYSRLLQSSNCCHRYVGESTSNLFFLRGTTHAIVLITQILDYNRCLIIKLIYAALQPRAIACVFFLPHRSPIFNLNNNNGWETCFAKYINIYSKNRQFSVQWSLNLRVHENCRWSWHQKVNILKNEYFKKKGFLFDCKLAPFFGANCWQF